MDTELACGPEVFPAENVGRNAFEKCIYDKPVLSHTSFEGQMKQDLN